MNNEQNTRKQTTQSLLTTQTFKEVLWAVHTLHLVKAVDSFRPSINHASACDHASASSE